MNPRAGLLAALLALAGCSVSPAPQPAAPEPPVPAEQPAEAVAPTAPAASALTVDHVWVRDADTPEQQAKQAASLNTLREKIVAGGSFQSSFGALGVDGTNWHVAEGETYPTDVLPGSVQTLPDGAISEIVPGDGGLHLFRILGREPVQ